MEQQDNMHILLSMQEHPEQYTDDQLHQLIADNPELAEQLEQLALTKQAFVKHEADEEVIPVEDEWQKFAAEHADEFEALDTHAPHTASIQTRWQGKRLMGILPYKVAASIVGILLTAGVAFAAIHIVRMVSQSQQQMQSSQTTSAKPATSAISTDTIQSDTTISAKPIVFDNVPLDKMLSQIASYYDKEVVFQNVDARNLRFYFVWKPEDSLETVLHRLNLFESITIEQKSDKIVVE